MADEQLKNAAKQNEECDFATVYYNKIEAFSCRKLIISMELVIVRKLKG